MKRAVGTASGSGRLRVGGSRFTRGRGNVFEDLGFRDASALLAKAELVSRIAAIISARGLTQEQAAAIMGVRQPKVSALLRGNLDGFSTDRLFRFLNALGADIEITIRPANKRRPGPRIRVVKERLAG